MYKKQISEIDPKSLQELKSFSSPPTAAVEVGRIACLVLREKITKKSGPWKTFVKLNSNPKAFLDSLQHLDLHSLDQAKMKQVRSKLNEPSMSVEAVSAVSLAAANLVRAFKTLSALFVVHENLGPESPIHSPAKLA